MTKIAIVGPLDPDSFADNLVDAARRSGHDVLGLGPAQPRLRPQRVQNVAGIISERSPRLASKLQSKLVTAALEFKPDVLVSVDRRLTSESVRRIGASGTKTALWFPDHVHNLGRLDVLLAGYDFLFFKNPILVSQLAEIYGVRAVYLPEGANPTWHRPVGEYGVDPSIVVAGNVYPTRALLLQRLLEAGIPLRIFGAPIAPWIEFPDLRQLHENFSVTREEKARAFRSSTAVLNNLHPAEFAGSNCRMFEAAASGAVVLTEPRQGMEELFEYGREVVPFRSFDQLVEAYRRLVAHPEEGRAIADAAAARAAREHTWDQRLDQLLVELL
ncbi:CgeB family protein [Microbacterium marinilacus]|uniref:Spore protein YkvP/CgeB glycosyl transferase-like domain-containing protein n=1 Tax=Microbacterium marinilacus TaxID=415209 RepID=A0ABP7BDN7_9MICO|nr:glycosyltransferase [Microbacterium marinilacus]MBY0689434.1 glycosyltransferase [Microbacterium marinilacus]